MSQQTYDREAAENCDQNKPVRVDCALEVAKEPAMKMLLITQCPDPLMWYANKIGEKVPYLGDWTIDGYKSREPAGHVNIVKFDDATIVDSR